MLYTWYIYMTESITLVHNLGITLLPVYLQTQYINMFIYFSKIQFTILELA